MMPAVFWTILGNATYIAAAFLLCAFLGWLWFRHDAIAGLSQSGNTLARLAIYPILGWLLVIVGSSWLRIPAVPFRVSAPYLLALLLIVPMAWQVWNLRREPGKARMEKLIGSIRVSGDLLVGIVLLFALCRSIGSRFPLSMMWEYGATIRLITFISPISI